MTHCVCNEYTDERDEDKRKQAVTKQGDRLEELNLAAEKDHVQRQDDRPEADHENNHLRSMLAQPLAALMLRKTRIES